MTVQNASRANGKELKPYDNGISIPFYRQKDADLETMEGRIEFFCKYFDCEPPKLEYDPDSPDSILMTEELMEWHHFEGASLDWIICGSMTGALATYREKYKLKPVKKEILDVFGSLDETEKKLFRAGLKLIVDNNAEVEAVLPSVLDQISEYRRNLKGTKAA